ncbi:monocarboxylate transporter 9-like [Ylistrum balloti]|uniref:monocarboxylate transporter 9-like n=1 Tax=Ylistrum balloti TaxID=509963 RepID=UPI002905CFCF|nr:monocarboxylate transporter 9-like [Ylistrum balloti]
METNGDVFVVSNGAQQQSIDHVTISSTRSQNKPPTAPDGGWGWVITFSSFMLNFLVDGVSLSVGIFFNTFLTTFGESKGKTQLLSSVINGVAYIVGPISGSFANRFGCRTATGLGIIIASVGIFFSTFSPSLDVMILLYGIIGGIGFGLVYTPTIVIVSYYFEKRRALATGIATCGSGIGGFVFAPLSVLLLEMYGWRGAFWVITGIVLNGVVFAAFYRELKSPRAGKELNNVDRAGTNNESNCRRTCSSVSLKFDCSLLKSPCFAVFSLSCFLMSTGWYIPFNFLPVLADDLNLSANEGALLISIIGISNTASNVVFGFIIDLPCVDSILLNSVVLVIGGVTTCLVPFCREFAILATYSALFGVVGGAFEPLNSLIIVELNGIEKLSNGFGLLNLFIGIASIIGSPIAGILSDVTAGYDAAFYFAGATITIAGIVSFPLRLIAKCENSNKDPSV